MAKQQKRKDHDAAMKAKRRFDAAHAKGMERLIAGDYVGMEKAINEESAAIGEFREATERKRSIGRVRKRR